MIRGLQMVIKAEALSRRIGERIVAQEATIAALDARLKERDGDAPFDCRIEDGFKTIEELQADRDRLVDRVTQLTMLRDGIVANETYTLNRRDLRAAGLITSEGEAEAVVEDLEWGDRAAHKGPITGLKLTFSGAEIRALLEARQRVYEERAAHWQRERERTPEDQTDERPRPPDYMCENEAEEHDWRAEVLGFLRDHIEADQTYRLSEADLAFGELLPEKPGWMQQSEYEERTGMAFSLGRIAKRFERLSPWDFCPQERAADRDE